jgi:hypothetical protein
MLCRLPTGTFDAKFTFQVKPGKNVTSRQESTLLQRKVRNLLACNNILLPPIKVVKLIGCKTLRG